MGQKVFPYLAKARKTGYTKHNRSDNRKPVSEVKPLRLTMPRFVGEPQFDRLPVHMLRCAAETPPNDRIYAQAQLCRTDERIFARIWTFESAPAPQVCLAAAFSANGHTVEARVTIGGEATLLLDGVSAENKLTAYLFAGEDLQGVFHGAVLAIDAEAFFETLGVQPDETAGTIGANLMRIGGSISALAAQGAYVPVE